MLLPHHHAYLLVIVGPTAVGKTALSLHLAGELNVEFISADSRHFYRGMDIGTAKATPKEQSVANHHLIDICEPDETITLAQYQRLAYRAIDEVQARGNLPVLVGGTGQYVKAVIEGWGIPEVAPRPRLRQALVHLGQGELARWLKVLDPAAGVRIDPRNVRRVIRALEVTLVRGQPISKLQRKKSPPYIVKKIGLRRERQALYQRVDDRVDDMMQMGLLAELEGLREAGYGRRLPAMSSLGYRQLYAYLAGELDLEQAIERIKYETHRFVRQQATWFRTDDKLTSWFDADDSGVYADISAHVESWLCAM